MNEETGIVIKVDGIMAMVAVKKKDACDACSAKDSCTSTSEDEAVLEAINTARAEVGQTVRISMKPMTYLKGTMLVYGLPLVMFLAGAIAGQKIGEEYFRDTSTDLVAAAAGFAALFISLLIIKIWSGKTESRKANQPVIEEILK
jgi:sigma-E factor negative regulatory protein RseC